MGYGYLDFEITSDGFRSCMSVLYCFILKSLKCALQLKFVYNHLVYSHNMWTLSVCSNCNVDATLFFAKTQFIIEYKEYSEYSLPVTFISVLLLIQLINDGIAQFF